MTTNEPPRRRAISSTVSANWVSMARQDEYQSTSSFERHIVQFHDPCVDLVPRGCKLHIDPPHHADSRRPPSPRHEGYSEFDTSFFYSFNLESSREFPDIPEKLADVENSIVLLQVCFRNAKGKTNVGILGYRPVSEQIITKLVVENSEDIYLCEEYLSDEDDWPQLMDLADTFDSIALIRDLVYQESDWACNHVRERLAKHLNGVPRSMFANQNAPTQLGWNTRFLRSAGDLFYGSIFLVGSISASEPVETTSIIHAARLPVPVHSRSH